MTSQLSSLLESRRIEDLLAVAAEGNLPNAKIANVQGRNTDIDTSAEDVTEIGGNYAPPTAARVHAIVSSSVEDGDDANAATGTITYGTPSNGDVVEVDGTTFTKAAAGSATEFSTIAQLTALINALPNVNATDNGTVITVTAATAGAAGNSITMSETGGLTVSDATLSGGDDANTTGVLSVRITGVDATYAEVIEDVTLGGTVSVNTTNSFLRINSMVALTVGSNGSAVGDITATAATDGTVSAKIAAGENESRNAFYTVPLNKTGFVFSMFGQMYDAASTIIATVEMLMREYGKGWVSRGVCSVNGGEENGSKFSAPIAVPAKADIKLRATTSSHNVDLVAGMQMMVIADL